MNIHDFLTLAVERQASDLHIIPGYFPAIRVNGELFQLKTADLLTPESSEKLILPILNEEQKDNFFANNEIDISYEFNEHRYRINVYNAKGAISAAFRLIPTNIKTIEELNLPSVFHKFTEYNQGLF